MPPSASTYDWSGIYIGGHVGGGWQSATFADPSAAAQFLDCCAYANYFSGPTPPSNGNGSSFLGGAQIGAMYQVGRLVVGVDFDWSKTSMHGTGNSSFLPGIYSGVDDIETANMTYGVKTNWTQTSTVTFGFAMDRVLFYGKGGLALANNSYSLSMVGTYDGDPPYNFASSHSAIVPGWTVGAGIKYEIMNNWIISAEYNYMNFSKTTNLAGLVYPSANIPFTPYANFNPTFNQAISEVKVGLSYKFDMFAPSAPVVAKY